MKNIFFFASLFFLPLAGFCQAEINKISLFDNKVLLELPEDLTPDKTTGENKKERNTYFSSDKTVRFTIEISQEEAEDNDIPGYTDKAISQIKLYPAGATLIDDGISLNDGKNIGYLKYITDDAHDKGYNYLFYGSLNNKLISFYFNCPKEGRLLWEKKIDKVVSSLRINDKLIQ